jgi:hypothetical protein
MQKAAGEPPPSAAVAAAAVGCQLVTPIRLATPNACSIS